MPKMKHPESSQTIEALLGQVAMYESQGWQVEKAPAKQKASTAKGLRKPNRPRERGRTS